MNFRSSAGAEGFKTPAQQTDDDPDLVHNPKRLLEMLGNDILAAALAMFSDTSSLERLKQAGAMVLQTKGT